MRSLVLLFLAGCASSSPAPVAATGQQEPVYPGRRPAAVGQPAPAIDLRAIDGTPARIVPGKVNVVFFWATWSEPDKKSMPPYERLWERHREEGLTLLGLSVDDEPGGVAELAHTYGARFPIAWDAGHRVADRYAPPAEPTSYVIDRKGVVRFVHWGWHEGEMEPIEAEVIALLRE